MSFEEAETVVNKWLDENPTVSLILSEESEGRMYFEIDNSGAADQQFYIELSRKDVKRWVVKTDCDDYTFIEQAKNLCSTRSDYILEDLLNCICTGKDETQCDNMDSDDYNEDDDYFYGDGDDLLDENDDSKSERKEIELSQNEEEFDRFARNGNPAAVQRLLKDMKSLKSSDGKFGVSGEPRGDNLFIWDVKLTNFEARSKLGEDLEQYSKKFKREAAIMLEMTFPDTYPMNPPFVRVLRPKFKFLTGHVTIGGSICMQLLTRTGWSPSNDIEGILIQIRSEIMSDPDARLDLNRDIEYTEAEAKDAFQRMVKKYNWESV